MFGKIELRKGQPETKLDRDAFLTNFKRQFQDPSFQEVASSLDAVAEVAWRNYEASRKAPVTVKAGAAFHDPEYQLSIEWLETARRLQTAQSGWATSPFRVLLINGSPRNEHTCPGEIPKSYRLLKVAEKALRDHGMEVDVLDLSLLTAEYGKKIYPCKACVSSAMPLCHWPCSCYPNHSLGQTQDWMNEIYERWVLAHGVLIITPVHWYQAPSTLKLMIDRLVCADGGNPDPTTTHGKRAQEAKQLEMKGWDYPKHLANRAFGLLVHGDTNGVDGVRRNLYDWLTDIGMIAAVPGAVHSQYIGYNQPYATSHEDLDKDACVLKEAENVAIALSRQVKSIRTDDFLRPDRGLTHLNQK